MAAILAAFDNANSAAHTLSNLSASPFAALLRPERQTRLLAFSASDEEVQRIQAAFPAVRARRAQRLLDNQEGAVRGGLVGLVAGAVMIQALGYGVYYFGRARPTELAQGAGIDASSAGALVALFLGFFGALIGGLVGYGLGRKWLGLPPELARRYEHRLERGELLLAVNQRRLVLDRPRRLKLRAEGTAGGAFSLERFYFWLGEHGAHDTRRVRGSVAALKIYSPADRRPLASPFYYSGFPDEDEDKADRGEDKK